MRFRQRTPIYETTSGNYKVTDAAGVVTTDTITTELHREATETMVDVVTPRFNALISKGIIINNPVFHTVHEKNVTVGTEKLKFTAYPLNTNQNSNRAMSIIRRSGSGWSVLPTGYEFWDNDILQLIAAARLDALSKIDKTPYAFLEDLFETDKTFRFLASPLRQSVILSSLFKKSARKYYASLLPFLGKRGGPATKAIAWAQATSRAWLEVRYAFRPLLISALNTTEQANINYSKNKPKRSRSHGKRAKNLLLTEDLLRVSGASYGFSHTLKRDVQVRAGVLYEDSSPFSHDEFVWQNGLRVKDIPRTVWAVMPYTFVLDRFIDIGKSISALVNLSDPTIKILAGWDVLFDERVETWTQTSFTPSSGWTTTSWVPGSDNEKYVYHNRTPWTPDFGDIIPIPLEKSIETSTYADIIAIIIGNLNVRRP